MTIFIVLISNPHNTAFYTWHEFKTQVMCISELKSYQVKSTVL